MGGHVSMDAYIYRFDKVTVDVENTKGCIDDSLLYMAMSMAKHGHGHVLHPM